MNNTRVGVDLAKDVIKVRHYTNNKAHLDNTLFCHEHRLNFIT